MPGAHGIRRRSIGGCNSSRKKHLSSLSSSSDTSFSSSSISSVSPSTSFAEEFIPVTPLTSNRKSCNSSSSSPPSVTQPSTPATPPLNRDDDDGADERTEDERQRQQLLQSLHQQQQEQQQQQPQAESVRAAGLKYHPLDVNGKREGYLGHLTSDQEVTLTELGRAVKRDGVDIGVITGQSDVAVPRIECEDYELCLLRFLRSNDWVVTAALDHLKQNVEWRREEGVVQLANLRPGQVLEVEDESGHRLIKEEGWRGGGIEGDEMSAEKETGDSFVEELFDRFYPHYHLGFDNQGRPVLLQRYGKFDTAELKKVIPLENLARYHLWEQERNARLLSRRTHETGYIQETYNVILDFKDMRLGMFNGDFLWLLKRLKQDDERYYCDRGGRTFIVNAPKLFNMIWQGIRGFMESTQSKLLIVPAGARGWSELLAFIPADQLPPEYGGTGPPLAKTPFLSAKYTSAQQRLRGEMDNFNRGAVEVSNAESEDSTEGEKESGGARLSVAASDSEDRRSVGHNDRPERDDVIGSDNGRCNNCLTVQSPHITIAKGGALMTSAGVGCAGGLPADPATKRGCWSGHLRTVACSLLAFCISGVSIIMLCLESESSFFW